MFVPMCVFVCIWGWNILYWGESCCAHTDVCVCVCVRDEWKYWNDNLWPLLTSHTPVRIQSARILVLLAKWGHFLEVGPFWLVPPNFKGRLGKDVHRFWQPCVLTESKVQTASCYNKVCVYGVEHERCSSLPAAFDSQPELCVFPWKRVRLCWKSQDEPRRSIKKPIDQTVAIFTPKLNNRLR